MTDRRQNIQRTEIDMEPIKTNQT